MLFIKLYCHEFNSVENFLNLHAVASSQVAV